MLGVQVALSERGLGCVEGDEFVLLDTACDDLGDLIAEHGSLKVLEGCRVVSRRPLAGTHLLPPLRRPRAVWGVGLNYRSKAAGTGRALPEQPILFLAAATSVGAPGAVVEIPELVAEPDYEAEIAIVVGRHLCRATPAEVWPSVAAITSANDMTARDVMRATGTPALAKSFAGFTPLGPSLCTPDALRDRADIRVRASVNGELRQDDTSAGMIFPVDELLSRLSYYATLEPGDVVLTGTPTGTGQDLGRFLADGDEVCVEIEGVLPLVTRVARPSAVASAVPVAGAVAGPAR
ncbi:fumarylacetoacetate hydrolase family protein [Jatrophihabitans fulvus]